MEDNEERFHRNQGSALGRVDPRALGMPNQKRLPPNVTRAMHQAIHWFKAQGGNGIKDKKGRMLCSGECPDFDPKTWLAIELERFIVFGHDTDKRWHITAVGHRLVHDYPKGSSVVEGLRHGKVEPFPGADNL